jgi:phage tail-like protein
MATIINNRSTLITDPLRNFRFLVTFIPQQIKPSTAGNSWTNSLTSATFGFTSVSGMAVQTDSIPYREGGYNTTVHQIPGQTSFAPLQLQRGVLLNSSQNWDWMKELFQTVQVNNTRKTPENFRCDIEIEVLSHPIAGSGVTTALADGRQQDHVAMRFRVFNAWVTSVAYSDLNAGDNAILVEQMAIVHEGFDVKWAPSLTESAAQFTV